MDADEAVKRGLASQRSPGSLPGAPRYDYDEWRDETAAFDPSLRGDGAWVFDDVVPVEVVLRDREDTLVKDARRVRVIATSDARVVVELLSEADLFSHLEADVDEAAFEGLRRAQGLDGDWAGFAGLVRDLAAKARDGAGAVLRLSLDCEGGGTLRAVAAHDARRVDLVALAVVSPHWRTTRALAEHRYFASAAARLVFARAFEGPVRRLKARLAWVEAKLGYDLGADGLAGRGPPPGDEDEPAPSAEFPERRTKMSAERASEYTDEERQELIKKLLDLRDAAPDDAPGDAVRREVSFRESPSETPAPRETPSVRETPPAPRASPASSTWSSAARTPPPRASAAWRKPTDDEIRARVELMEARERDAAGEAEIKHDLGAFELRRPFRDGAPVGYGTPPDDAERATPLANRPGLSPESID